MKKILTCMLALFAAVSLYATDLNIYASGLKVHQTAGGVTIDYVLNAPATELNVKLYNGEILTTTIPITDPANLTKGAHTGVAIDLSALAAGHYTWAIEAKAAAHADLAEVLPASSDYYFYGPRGVAVDNCPESPYFGRVYVGNAFAGKTASDPNCRDSEQGMYIFDATLAPLYGGTAYDGNVSWTQHGVVTVSDGSNSDWGPYRIAVDEDGYVFICDNGAANGTSTGVYMMDPAHPENDFVSVLGQAGANANFHRANSLAVTGSGNKRVLYLNDWTDSIVSYPVGNNFPYTAKGVAVVPDLLASKIANAQNSIARDNKGGFWVCQYRGQLDAYHQLAHFNSLGYLDCSISTGNNESLAVPRTRRGALGLSPSNEFVVIGGGGTIQVIRVSENGGAPVLSALGVDMPDNIGNNVDGLAIDYADNVYVVSATKELLRIFAIPKTENKCETPAPSSQDIALPYVEQLYEIGSNQGWTPNAGIAMEKISANVFQIDIDFEVAGGFTFTTTLGETWDDINLFRYGATNNDDGVTSGNEYDLHYGWGNSFTIPAGKFRLTADLNRNKLHVVEIVDHLYEFDTRSGSWVFGDGEELSKIDEGIFEGDFTFGELETYFVFSSVNGADWDAIASGRLHIDATGDFAVVNDNSVAGITSYSGGSNTFKMVAGRPGKYHFVVDFNTNTITITRLSTLITVSEAGYATYFNSAHGYKMPASMSGYVYNVENGLVKVINGKKYAPADMPLVLQAAEGTYELTFRDDVAPIDVESQLHGSDEATMTDVIVPGEYKYYGLSLDAENNVNMVGFYWIANNGAAFENGAHKAFLAVPVTSGGSEAPAILFNENGATNVETIKAQEGVKKFIENGRILIEKNGITYDTMGRIVR